MKKIILAVALVLSSAAFAAPVMAEGFPNLDMTH
jgi:hypothetical protein